MNPFILRTIQQSDNAAVANIIRTSLAEFGVDKPGTVYFDQSTDHLYELFQKPGSTYYVAEQNDQLIGGAGIFPSAGLPDHVCELVKMYLKKEARGLGLGKTLVEKCLDFARSTGFERIYLESFPELGTAVSMYEKFGFTYLRGPLGNTGHFGCNVWMIKNL
jgi:putative acetyltransferase